MEQAGILCEAVRCDTDESVEVGVPPQDAVRVVSIRKAECAARSHAFIYRDGEPGTEENTKRVYSEIVISADTLVYANNKLLGKPKDPADAFSMLKTLRGAKHTVYTGVSMIGIAEGKREKMITFVESADVFFRSLSDSEIYAYIGTGEPMDKAGAYGAQGFGSVFIERVEGDVNTVIGLPVSRLTLELKNFGIDVTLGWKALR